MSRTITIYTSEGCGYCRKLKNFLAEHSLDYTEKNVTAHPEYLEELQAQGIWAVPTVFIGDQAVPGYRPNQLKEILELE